MIDPAAEHDKANPLACFDFITRAHAAHDPPGQVAGNLNHRMAAPFGVLKSNQVALVVLARVVAVGGAKFARRMLDGDHFTADRSTIHMYVERGHEDRDPSKAILR